MLIPQGQQLPQGPIFIPVGREDIAREYDIITKSSGVLEPKEIKRQHLLMLFKMLMGLPDFDYHIFVKKHLLPEFGIKDIGSIWRPPQPMMPGGGMPGGEEMGGMAPHAGLPEGEAMPDVMEMGRLAQQAGLLPGGVGTVPEIGEGAL